MKNPLFPFKLNGISIDNLNCEIDSEIKFLEDKKRWKNCYFHRVDSDLLHDHGTCEPCDWKRYMKSVSQENLDNFNFIEAWEWHDYWVEKVKT